MKFKVSHICLHLHSAMEDTEYERTWKDSFRSLQLEIVEETNQFLVIKVSPEEVDTVLSLRDTGVIVETVLERVEEKAIEG